MPKFKVQVQLDYLPRYCKTLEVEIEADDAEAAEEQAIDNDYSKEFRDLDNSLNSSTHDWDLDNDDQEVTVVDCEPIEPEEDEEEPASD